MESTTIRINPKAHTILRRIAKQAEESMQASLIKAIELYRRQIFLQKANVAFEALRKDPKAWKEELKEREHWDSAERLSKCLGIVSAATLKAVEDRLKILFDLY